MLTLTINDSYTFYTNNYSLSTTKLGTLISFVTKSYIRGSIIDVSNTKLINVISEKNNLSILSNLRNAKLYLNNIINRLKIKKNGNFKNTIFNASISKSYKVSVKYDFTKKKSIINEGFLNLFDETYKYFLKKV